MPSVTNRVWPFGCVCHAVLALGSNRTLVALIRERSEGLATGVIVTDPVKNSLGAGPVSLPLLVTFIADPPVVARSGRHDASREQVIVQRRCQNGPRTPRWRHGREEVVLLA
jgi:hypothetical protein